VRRAHRFRFASGPQGDPVVGRRPIKLKATVPEVSGEIELIPDNVAPTTENLPSCPRVFRHRLGTRTIRQQHNVGAFMNEDIETDIQIAVYSHARLVQRPSVDRDSNSRESWSISTLGHVNLLPCRHRMTRIAVFFGNQW